MDWLEWHKVVLDCYTKILSYKDDFGTIRTSQGIPKPVLVRQVLAMQLKKCIRKGCQVYAIQVMNLFEKEDKPKLEDFAVLSEFRDMFVDEIPELPCRREIVVSPRLSPAVKHVMKWIVIMFYRLVSQVFIIWRIMCLLGQGAWVLKARSLLLYI